MERFDAGELAYMLDMTVAAGSAAESWLVDTGEAIVESLSQDEDLWEYPAGRDQAVERARGEAISEPDTSAAWLIVGELRAWNRVDWEVVAATGTHWDGKAGLMLPPQPQDLAAEILINVAESLIPSILAELIDRAHGQGEEGAADGA